MAIGSTRTLLEREKKRIIQHPLPQIVFQGLISIIVDTKAKKIQSSFKPFHHSSFHSSPPKKKKKIKEYP